MVDFHENVFSSSHNRLVLKLPYTTEIKNATFKNKFVLRIKDNKTQTSTNRTQKERNQDRAKSRVESSTRRNWKRMEIHRQNGDGDSTFNLQRLKKKGNVKLTLTISRSHSHRSHKFEKRKSVWTLFLSRSVYNTHSVFNLLSNTPTLSF